MPEGQRFKCCSISNFHSTRVSAQFVFNMLAYHEYTILLHLHLPGIDACIDFRCS